MIREIAYKINDLSRGYNIGKLQSIRTKIKKMKKRPGTDIFQGSTINDEWACHSGGRKELQFNIGLEDEKFRYGIALSLETSRTVPDVTILFPKARRLNQFIRQHQDFFAEYEMWCDQWCDQDFERIYIGPVKEISDAWLKSRTFIFIGKLQPENKIDFKKVLKTFDELLTPYIFVEKSENSGIVEYINENDEFKFEVKNRKLPKNRDYSLEEKAVNPNVRHSLIQEKLIKKLREKYGYKNVSPENKIGGKKIDVVLRNGKEFVFYEVKVSDSTKACIRDAIGQLMEYAYWPGRKNADLLVVVGEEEIDNKTTLYLKYLKDKFNLPIQYEKISID